MAWLEFADGDDADLREGGEATADRVFAEWRVRVVEFFDTGCTGRVPDDVCDDVCPLLARGSLQRQLGVEIGVRSGPLAVLFCHRP